jgi:hypothetical protein
MRLLSRPLAIFYDTNRARVLDVLLSTTNSMSGRQIARMAGISPTTAGSQPWNLPEWFNPSLSGVPTNGVFR